MKKYILSSMILGASLFVISSLKADAEESVVSYLESMINQCDEVFVETQESYTEALAAIGSLQDDIITCEATLIATEQSLESYQEVLAGVEDLGPVTKIAAGGLHTVILLENGSVWAAGNNNNGQLGTGDQFERTAFTQMVTDPSDIFIDIAAGDLYTAVLKSDGTVWATGDNGSGQLGIGTSGDFRITLTEMIDSNNSDIIAIAASYRTIVLKSNGTVWGTGDNWSGSLGIGTSGDTRTTLTAMTDFNSSVAAIATGFEHTIVLKNDGTVWATGDNNDGQLGIGSFDQQITLTAMTDFNSSITALAAGGFYSLVLKNDGTVWATGANDFGQLGIGTLDPQLTLTAMTDFNSSITALAAGFYHSLVLKSDGTVWATGRNENGQLGIGSTNPQPILTAMTENNSAVSAIAGGDRHSVVLKNNGRVWATGYNLSGQLARGLNSTDLPEATTLGVTERSIQP